MEKKIMVVGFSFDNELNNVALILKNKPDWQRGKLNGIGGKKEEIDVYDWDIMTREFKEETGVKTCHYNWNKFAILEGIDWRVICFYSKDHWIYEEVKTVESEIIIKIPVAEIWSYDTIFNLKWLIPLAIQCELSTIENIPLTIQYKSEF